jgi:hypothetical protein
LGETYIHIQNVALFKMVTINIDLEKPLLLDKDNNSTENIEKVTSKMSS